MAPENNPPAFAFECCPYELWARLRKIRKHYRTQALAISVVKRKYGFGLLMVCDNGKTAEFRRSADDNDPEYICSGSISVGLEALMSTIQPTEGAFVRCRLSAAPCGGLLYVARTRDKSYIDGEWRDANSKELIRAIVPALAA